MIKIKNLTIKNFMSVGNITQGITFENDLTLVLGKNLDLGDNGNRNGTGKTTIINALCYALYGEALTKIKLGNLVNKTNDKGMLVSVEFTKNGTDYKIERGRKPNILKLYIGDTESDDSAQGENRETQNTIEELLGISHEMFKHIVALTTYTEPFLNMKVADQREIIEQLLGITILSEKAATLKELIKDVKDKIKSEEFRINAIKESNKAIESQIKSLELRNTAWNESQIKDVENYAAQIEALSGIDIEKEIANHKLIETINENSRKQITLNSDLATIKNNINIKNNSLTSIEKELVAVSDHKCHACGQQLHDEMQTQLLTEKSESVTQLITELDELENNKKEKENEIAQVIVEQKPSTQYNSLEDALNHKHSIESLVVQMEKRAVEENPYTDQIQSIKEEALQDIDYTLINESNTLLEHQNFLLKLLTDKDSFVRKQIISQNLSYLNSRLTHYIRKTGLNHLIEFKDDLSVEISHLGKDYDFDNLSRGEKNRVILSLSWAFRDVWENLYTPINLIFVDELVDSGMDDAGVENALVILKTMAREQNKSVWLISHKNELISRVNNVLEVVKEDGFTNFEPIQQ